MKSEQIEIESPVSAGHPKKKYSLTFSLTCFRHVNLNTVVHFVHNFPQQLFNLRLHVDWYEFMDEKSRFGQVVVDDDGRVPLSPLGIPLQRLCIENESNQTWHLK